ncbi:g955 [Coccomyxa elongata]
MVSSVRTDYILAIPLGFTSIDEAMKFAAVKIALLEPSVDFPAHHRLSSTEWNSIQEADARDETFGETVAHECLLIPE